MKKIVIAGVLVLLALPILPRLIPAAKTLDRFQAAFEEGGYAVESATVSTTPQLEAIGQLSMTIDGDFNERGGIKTRAVATYGKDR